nr:unnamed protein product [Callosobruchus analis]
MLGVQKQRISSPS